MKKGPRWVLAGTRLRRSLAATVPVWWPAVFRGEGTFETIGCEGGEALLWQEHTERMGAALVALGVEPPPFPAPAHLRRLLAREGVLGSGAMHCAAFAHGARCRLFTWAYPYRPPHRARREGIAVLPLPAPSGPLTGLKTSSYLAFTRARAEATAQGYDAALLIDSDGAVREADHANLFAVLGGVVVTPPAPRRCLPGVLRQWCLRTLADAGIPVEERDFSLEDLLASQGAWVSSSLAGLRPVRRVGESQLPVPPAPLAVLRTAGIPCPGYAPGGRAKHNR